MNRRIFSFIRSCRHIFCDSLGEWRPHHKQLVCVCNDEGPVYKSSRRVNFFFPLSFFFLSGPPRWVVDDVHRWKRWRRILDMFTAAHSRFSLTHQQDRTEHTREGNSITCPRPFSYLFASFLWWFHSQITHIETLSLADCHCG